MNLYLTPAEASEKQEPPDDLCQRDRTGRRDRKGQHLLLFSVQGRYSGRIGRTKLRKASDHGKKTFRPDRDPPFTRMAMIFQACRNSSSEYLRSREGRGTGAQEESFLHQKYLNHLITELKPVLAEIIKQGIDKGEISLTIQMLSLRSY